ncbi:MAG TPA: T9SS type A sorting domain-containing protein, partial [Flavipsychrobacter sp.]|nr:T9SS type A sorting domain-containing protein [Flavipsychrobacter sp.]
STGIFLWQKALGGSGNEDVHSIAATYDGGVIVAGQTSSYDGDVSGPIGVADFWVVKLDVSGNLQWEKSYGSFGPDWASNIYQTKDSGYVVSGITTDYPTGGIYAATIKIDKYGVLDTAVGWTATFIAKPTQDGGYVGLSWLSPYDCTVQKMDSSFNVTWSKTMGGSANEVGKQIIETDDGGYVIAATSQSNDGDVSGNHGGIDYWVVKLKGIPNSITAPPGNETKISLYPNPVKNKVYFSEKTNARLVNSLGQVVVSAQGISSLNMENYPRGVYFILFYDKKGTIISKEKVVKQ